MAGALDKATKVAGLVAVGVTVGTAGIGLYTKAALAATNDRVSRLEEQRSAIERSLDRIERRQEQQSDRIERIFERVATRK